MDYLMDPKVLKSDGFFIGSIEEERGPIPLRWVLVIPLQDILREKSKDLKWFLKKHYPKKYDELVKYIH